MPFKYSIKYVKACRNVNYLTVQQGYVEDLAVKLGIVTHVFRSINHIGITGMSVGN